MIIQDLHTNELNRGRAHGFWAMWALVALFALLSWAFSPEAKHTTFINGVYVKCAEISYTIYMCEGTVK